jgi:proteasome accessory factor C
MSDTAADQLRRVLQIIPELADDGEHKLDEVAGLVGVDRKRLLKDLKSLADRFDDPGGFVEGVQIYVTGDAVSLRSDHFLRPMRLTVAELSALELGLALLRAERAPEEQPALDRARARLVKVLAKLPKDEPAVAARVASTGPEIDSEWLPELRRAMKGKRKLRIRYRSANATEGAERVVSPYATVFASGAWYLVAQCERSGGLRVFRLDRIEELVATDEAYEVPDGFSLDNVVRDGRVFLGQPTEEVKIWYGPAVARWVAERVGRPLEDDGSVTLSYPLADPRWVVRHVLQYGAEARVLSPESARAAVREALERITAAAK